MLFDVLDTYNLTDFDDNYTYRDFNDIDDMAYDIEAINNGITNVLTTMKGSVPGKPSFGSTLHLIPFSLLDYVTINTFKLAITASIKEWETRITLNSVSVTYSEEYNKLIADINYTYSSTTVSVDGSVSVSLSDL